MPTSEPPPGRRRALLIATDTYRDPGLRRLRSPVGDVRALAEVLADPVIGGFQVALSENQATPVVAQTVEGIFAEARPSDLLLLYISGHGVLSQDRSLYFAMTNTNLRFIRSSAIADGFISGSMAHSRCRSIVLVLDCCHSGAFGKGLAPKSRLSVDVEHRFEGRGQITLTASSELEYAFEDEALDDLGASAPGSLFTRFLVEGLRSGEADIDEDGLVSVDELYDYIYDRVRERSAHQTPGKSGQIQGDLYLARSARRMPLAPALRQALVSPLPAVRHAAVGELLRRWPDAGVDEARAIELALRRAAGDEHDGVARTARAGLGLEGAASVDGPAGPVTDDRTAVPPPTRTRTPAQAIPAVSRPSSPPERRPTTWSTRFGHWRGILRRWIRPLRSGRRRVLAGAAALAVVLVLAVGGAWAVGRSQYFVGTDQGDRTVALYRGLPYEIGPMKLYTREANTGITLSSIPASQREAFTNHELRSREDAERLIDGIAQAR